MSESFLAGNGSIWVQPNGAGTELFYLGCHDVLEISGSRGDASTVYTPDPVRPNHHESILIYRDKSETPNITISAKVHGVLDWLESLGGLFNLYIMEVDAGRKDDFTNYSRAWVLHDATVSTFNTKSIAVSSPSAQESTIQTFEVFGRVMYEITAENAIWQVPAINGLDCTGFDMIGPERLFPSAKHKQAIYRYIYAVTEEPSGMVQISDDGGNTWIEALENPFGGTTRLACVVVLQTSPTTHRVIVARQEVAGNNYILSYSDDFGISWTQIDMGISNIVGSSFSGESLFAASTDVVWFISTAGDLFRSLNAGLTFANMGNYANCTSIKFLSAKVGFFGTENSAIFRTLDGGNVWTEFEGPSGLIPNTIGTISPITKEHIWVGFLSGELYYCKSLTDANWVRSTIPPDIVQIHSISFRNELLGFIAAGDNLGKPKVMRTINGGRTWEEVTLLANSELSTNIKMVAENLAYVSSSFAPTAGYGLLTEDGGVYLQDDSSVQLTE